MLGYFDLVHLPICLLRIIPMAVPQSCGTLSRYVNLDNVHLTATGSYRNLTCFPVHRNLYHFMIYIFIFQPLIKAALSNHNFLVHVGMYMTSNP